MAIKIGVLANPTTGLFDGLCTCGYTTSHWPAESLADERIRQHRQEHVDGTPMELIEDFRERHGLVPDGNAARFYDAVKDGSLTIIENEEN